MPLSRTVPPALLLLVACTGSPPTGVKSVDATASPSPAPSDAVAADAAPGGDLAQGIAKAKREPGPRIGREWGPPAGLVRSEFELLEGEDESLNVEGIIHSFYWDGVERCYDKALEKHAGLEGRVVVTFTIGKNGLVSKSEVKGFDADLDACIAARVKKWHFKIEHGPKSYRAPFELNKNPQPRPIN